MGHADLSSTQIYAHYAPDEHEIDLVNQALQPLQPAMGVWPMSGWLAAFADAGLIVWEPGAERPVRRLCREHRRAG